MASEEGPGLDSAPDPVDEITDSSAESKTLRARVLSGSAVLLTGSGLVTGINFAYNIAVARFLGPTGFGHASAVYTVLILISAVTLSFQIVCAKVVSQQKSSQARGTAYRGFHKSAWASGIFIALLLLSFRNAVADYLNLPTPVLVIWLAIGVAFYVPLGSRRGYLQGACGFRRLALNLVLEGFVRLAGSLVFIAMGFGVTGVIAANAAAVGIAYTFVLPALPPSEARQLQIPDAFREALQAIVFFVGQVVINNCDIVVVKHFFRPTSAGVYAAVALVGRVIFALSWAVVNTMFPIVAGARTRHGRDHSVLGTSLLLVFAIGALVTLGLRLAPGGIWSALFGAQFAMTGKYGLPYLLSLYAATTAVYSLSVVIIAYEMSYKIANTGWVQLAFSGVLIAGIYRFHSSLQQVIWVQLIMMVFLLMIVAIPFFMSLIDGFTSQSRTMFGRLRTIRRVSEDEVIAEFLKNDFHDPVFEDYQESLRPLVTSPDLNNPGENETRRALLFLRHGALWRELPSGTEWFEAEVYASDLHRIHVFPRSHWRKLAGGNFTFPEIIRSFSTGRCFKTAEESFLTKISGLRTWIASAAEKEIGCVLLIGLDENGPMTILDGNHRFVAAALTSTETFQKFRFFCGLSPDMVKCCWYKTNLATLFHYGTNMLRYLRHDAEAELERLLQSSP